MSSDKRKRSGISIERASRIQTKLETRLKDIFSAAVSFKSTSQDIDDRVNERVFGDKDFDRAPQYVQGYIEGYCVCLRGNISQQHITWALMLDGKLVSRSEVDQITCRETERLWRDFARKCDASVEEYRLHGGSCRQPPTFEEFKRDFSQHAPSGYKSPWMRVNGDLSRHVWVNERTGLPMYDKPYDRKWLPQVDVAVAAAATLSRKALLDAAKEGAELGMCDED